MKVQARAPGKLFILGEYAVLEGGPAVVAAVDRWAHATVTPADRWTLHATGIGIPRASFHVAADQLVADAPDPRLGLFTQVWRATLGGAVVPPAAVTLDTRAFVDEAGQKLGLGSSAAVAAALTGALCAWRRKALPPVSALFPMALAAHRAAQGGVGSGADVAAAVHGGCVHFQKDAVHAHLGWPRDLAWMPIFVGHAASTPALVGAVRALRTYDPDAYRRAMALLSEIAQEGLASWHANSASGVRRAVTRYRTGLEALGQASETSIVSEPHRRAARVVMENGGVYKPSGAGGGDFGLAFPDDADGLSTLAEALIQAGLKPFSVALAPTGVQVEIVPAAAP